MRLSGLHPSFFVLLAIGAVVVWRIVVRVRRLVGRQRIAPAWPWLAVVLFPGILIALFMVALVKEPRNALALVVGAAVGAAIAVIGLRLTRFERTTEGYFYTPNAPIGLALAAVFIVRLAYRAWALYRSEEVGGSVIAGFGQSPLTLGVFAVLATYYAVYAGGLLDWRHRRAAREAIIRPDHGATPAAIDLSDEPPP